MKKFIGKVVDAKMPKTAKVAVFRLKIHPLYRKRLKVKKVYLVHDELGVKIGDEVKFQGCRPISKSKRWQIIEIVGKVKEKAQDKKEKKEKRS
jgi:small subunit ribosomal protein S17